MEEVVMGAEWQADETHIIATVIITIIINHQSSSSCDNDNAMRILSESLSFPCPASLI